MKVRNAPREFVFPIPACWFPNKRLTCSSMGHASHNTFYALLYHWLAGNILQSVMSLVCVNGVLILQIM